MANGRALAIGLDGCELSYARQLMDEGRLPVLSGQFARGATVRLEHGAATRTGLAWEHFWSGRSPEAAERPAAVEFDVHTYTAWAEGARFEPFYEGLDVRTVVFDAPYADLGLTPGTRGVVAWGCHDPGLTGLVSTPPGLLDELTARVGPYPSHEWMYRSPWPSVDATRAMGRALVEGIETRSRAARWLLTERLPDWELGIVVAAELHSASEAFWHGVDATHPLATHPSAPAAAEAMLAAYEAIDRFVGELLDTTEADTVVLFSMNGMGPNQSDVPSMVLLPELLSRWSSGRRLLDVPDAWSATPSVVPPSSRDAAGFERSWYPSISAAPPGGELRRAARFLPRPVHQRVSRMRSARRARSRPTGYQSVDWQPADWYQPWWSEMRAFALPSFYDGRVRVNVRGREDRGIVDPGDYVATCEELEALLRSCVSPWDGAPAVTLVERPGGDDPFSVGSSGADLVVVWGSGVFALEHPDVGLIGPVPLRRTGGHTGPYGFASVTGPGVAVGDRGIVSSFDVAPTILDLIGRPPETPSGSSFLERLRSVPTS